MISKIVLTLLTYCSSQTILSTKGGIDEYLKNNRPLTKEQLMNKFKVPSDKYMLYWYENDQCSNSQILEFTEAFDMHKDKVANNLPVFMITGPYVFMKRGAQDIIEGCIAKAKELGDLPDYKADDSKEAKESLAKIPVKTIS